LSLNIFLYIGYLETDFLIVTEAEYAYKLKKDFIAVRVEKDYIPDGWLGMLLGIKMHHDLCDETNYEQILTDIINEIGERGKGAPIGERIISRYKGWVSLVSLSILAVALIQFPTVVEYCQPF